MRRRGPNVRPPSAEAKLSRRRSPEPCVSFTTTITRFGAVGSTATAGSSRIRAAGPSSRTVRAAAPGAAVMTATAASAAAALPPPKLLLEPLDHLDRPGVDAAQDGQVQRDEVAEQHQREQALGRALTLRLHDES